MSGSIGSESAGTGPAYTDYQTWGNDVDLDVAAMARTQRRKLQAEEELMLAVLQVAIADVEGPVLRHQAEAIRWLESEDRDWPHSFERICEHFGFAADRIRATVLGQVSAANRAAIERAYPKAEVLQQRILDVLWQSIGSVRAVVIHRKVGGEYPYFEQVLRRMYFDGTLRQDDRSCGYSINHNQTPC